MNHVHKSLLYVLFKHCTDYLYCCKDSEFSYCSGSVEFALCQFLISVFMPCCDKTFRIQLLSWSFWTGLVIIRICNPMILWDCDPSKRRWVHETKHVSQGVGCTCCSQPFLVGFIFHGSRLVEWRLTCTSLLGLRILKVSLESDPKFSIVGAMLKQTGWYLIGTKLQNKPFIMSRPNTSFYL